jgi:Glutaredoxin-like domain (DUF836)
VASVIVFYRRAGCHLCDEARTALDAILDARAATGRAPTTVEERDIDADDELRRRFMTTIPVVEIGDRRLELAISPAKLRRFVAESLDAPERAETPA